MTADSKPDGDIAEMPLETISKLARERRQATRHEIEAVPPPDFIVSTEQAEVLTVFRPADIPLTHVNHVELSDRLKDAYGLDFATPNLAPLLADMSREQLAALSVDEAISTLIGKGDEVALQFRNGRFEVDRYHFVTIRSVSIDYEKVLVVVGGPSKVAELVLADTVEALWASTGTAKRWDHIEGERLLVSYATRTRVQLPTPFEVFLGSPIRKFIDAHLVGGENFARWMAGLSKRHAFQPSPSVATVFTLDEVHCYFHHFDQLTGRTSRTKVTFSVTARDEYGTGIVVIDSQLPYEQHVEMLAVLVSTLSSLSDDN